MLWTHTLTDLTPLQFLVVMKAATHHKFITKNCIVEREVFVKETGLSEIEIISIVKELVSKRILNTRYSTNTYKFIFPQLKRYQRSVEGTPDNEVFDRFWQLYPKKTSKKTARAAWEKLNPDTEVYAAILLDLKTHFVNTEPAFIPMAATYLNGERWTDEGEARSAKPYNYL